MQYDKIGNHLRLSQYGISIEMNTEGIGYPIYRMNEMHNMLCDIDVDKYADISKDDATAAGKEAIADKISGNIVKEIYVPGRIINIVVK